MNSSETCKDSGSDVKVRAPKPGVRCRLPKQGSITACRQCDATRVHCCLATYEPTSWHTYVQYERTLHTAPEASRERRNCRRHETSLVISPQTRAKTLVPPPAALSNITPALSEETKEPLFLDPVFASGAKMSMYDLKCTFRNWTDGKEAKEKNDPHPPHDDCFRPIRQKNLLFVT